MNYMRTHLKEAIELNSTRLPLYAEVTGNASVPFSKSLIRRERLASPVAAYFDFAARKFQKKGIPIIAQEFVSMRNTPAFATRYPANIDYTRPLLKIDPTRPIGLMNKANRQNDFPAVKDIAASLLSDLAEQPHVYCMFRHLLESARRCAFMAERHQETAGIVRFCAPIRLSSQLIAIHLLSLPASLHFDEKVAFIQLKGVPFLYNDLPGIGLEPNSL